MYLFAQIGPCPGHIEIKSQLIDNRLRFFICHCAATASPSPMAGKRVSACDRNKRISTNLSKGGGICGRLRPLSNPCIRAAAPCSAVVRPIRERSASRKTSCHSPPQYFDAKSIKPEKFRRTGKFRVGKTGEKVFSSRPKALRIYITSGTVYIQNIYYQIFVNNSTLYFQNRVFPPPRK